MIYKIKKNNIKKIYKKTMEIWYYIIIFEGGLISGFLFGFLFYENPDDFKYLYFTFLKNIKTLF